MNKTENPGVVLDYSLTLKYQIVAVNDKATGGVINVAKILNFIARESKLKLVHCLVLIQIGFCNTLLYGLTNLDFPGLQIILNAAVRFIVNMPKYSQKPNPSNIVVADRVGPDRIGSGRIEPFRFIAYIGYVVKNKLFFVP